MTKIYEEPEITIISFEVEDIMSSSGAYLEDWAVVTGPEAIDDH